MKAFRFTLEAVQTIRQRQENEAMEHYARALLARVRAMDSLETVRQRMAEDYARRREMLAAGCTAAQAAQAAAYHRSLEKMREDGVAALGHAERRVHATFQAMISARQQREMVDVFRDKQRAAHQRAQTRDEQKTLDEFAGRRLVSRV